MRPRPERHLLTSPLRSALATVTLAALLVAVPAHDARGQPGGDLDAIRKRLADAGSETALVLNGIRSLDSKIFAVNKSIERHEKETSKLKSQIRSTEAHIVELEAEMVRVRRSSNARARQMYKNGPANILAVLFSADSFGDLPRLGMFWERLAARDGKSLEESTLLKVSMAEQRGALAGALQKLAGRVNKANADRASLSDARDQRTGSLVNLKEVVQQALSAEKAVLAAGAAAVKQPSAGTAAVQQPAPGTAAVQQPAPAPCFAGSPAADRKLAALLDWYAPASGGAGFMPAKLGPTGVVTNGGATWYGPGFDGCRSASGATFKAVQMTAASLSLPMGTLLKVVFGGKAVVVVITDRGPYSGGRILDLSQAAARSIGLSGVGEVSMEILLPGEPAPAFP